MSMQWNPEQGVTANAAEIDTMASVLEARHGALASEIAEFFAAVHGEKGDPSRSWAWNIVAETIHRRAQARQVEH